MTRYYLRRIYPTKTFWWDVSTEDEEGFLKYSVESASNNILGDVVISVEGEDAESFVGKSFSCDPSETYKKIGTPNPNYCLVLKESKSTAMPNMPSRELSREELDDIVKTINKEFDEIDGFFKSIIDYKGSVKTDDLLLAHLISRYDCVDLEKAFPDLDEKIENLQRLKEMSQK